MKRLGFLVVLIAGTVALAGTAAAQEPDDEVRDVVISYEIGDFDSEHGDWPIVAVEVRGQLDTEQTVTVELWGAGERLWLGTVGVTPPVTRLEVVPFVAVGDLVEVGIWQELTAVESIEVIPPASPVALPDPPPEPEEEAAEEDQLAPTEVEGEQLDRSDVEILGGASGGSGSGQLALSMILAIVVLAIVFRTPLPSASTQRWTK